MEYAHGRGPLPGETLLPQAWGLKVTPSDGINYGRLNLKRKAKGMDKLRMDDVVNGVLTSEVEDDGLTEAGCYRFPHQSGFGGHGNLHAKVQ